MRLRSVATVVVSVWLLVSLLVCPAAADADLHIVSPAVASASLDTPDDLKQQVVFVPLSARAVAFNAILDPHPALSDCLSIFLLRQDSKRLEASCVFLL